MKKRRVACVRCGRQKWTKLDRPRCTRKDCKGIMITIQGQMSLGT